jgi:hypothetical protein
VQWVAARCTGAAWRSCWARSARWQTSASKSTTLSRSSPVELAELTRLAACSAIICPQHAEQRHGLASLPRSHPA